MYESKVGQYSKGTGTHECRSSSSSKNLGYERRYNKQRSYSMDRFIASRLSVERKAKEIGTWKARNVKKTTIYSDGLW